ncbi:Ulp1 peptidase [Bertholletia excelsa]
MKSSCKRFDVFDFKEEDELAELASHKLVSKFKNPSAIDEYKFLQNITQENNIQSKEVANLPYMDIDAIDNDHNCDIDSYIPLGMEGEDPDTKQMRGLNDALLCDTTSHEQHAQFVLDKLNTRISSAQAELRALSSGATFPGDIQLNSAHGESSSCGDSVGVISDADESTSDSAPSTSSDIPENDVSQDRHGPLSDNCFGNWKLDDRDVAVVYPEYIVYSGRYCTETILIFSSSCIELKCLTADGSQEMLRFQWGIDDIVDIKSKCSERIQNPSKGESWSILSFPCIEELCFAVVDLNWYQKQEEIMTLDVRYKALWNVAFEEAEALPGQNGVCIPNKRYFPIFEPFEEVVYPKGDSDAVSISKRDVDLLQPDTFVNDTIIDFYIKYLKNEMEPLKRNRFHFFNSFFFRKLIDLDKDPSSAFEGRAAFQRVRKWTRKVNLFEKDYVFIPVNFNYHWSLIVICHPGEVDKFPGKMANEDLKKSQKVPCILHMDSIKGNHTGLKDLVQSQLPQQQNSFDCGLFLLHYVECFLADAPLEFNPFKITKFSNFLNVDWFPPGEPSLKRAKIQKLICAILEKENSPAASSGKPSASNHLANTNEMETGVAVVSERCSPLNGCHGNLSSSQAGQGIEITLLSASSQCVGDTGLVLKELFDPGATGGPFINGQYPTFDRATSFNEFKGAISAMEEDVEATAQFVYSHSSRTGMEHVAEINSGACVFPYSSRDLGADTSWNPGLHQDGHEDIVTSTASVCGSDDSSEVEEVEENNEVEEAHGLDSVEVFDASERQDSLEDEVKENNEVEEDHDLDSVGVFNASERQDSLEAEVKENNEIEKDLGQESLEVEEKDNNVVEEVLPQEERRMDQPVVPLTENFESTPDAMVDVAESQFHVLDSNGKADHPIPYPKECEAQENGDPTCADICSVRDDASGFGSDGQQIVERTDDDLPPLLDEQSAAKRMADDDLVLESDELQPAKRPRLSPPLEGEGGLTISTPGDGQL